MSVRAMAVIWRHYPGGGGELVLAQALADWANDQGRGIYPSVPASARKTRMSERQVQRLLRKMEEAGYLDPDGETEYGTRRYRLRLDRIEALPVVYGAREEADVTPGDKMSPGNIRDQNPAGGGARNDTMSRDAEQMSPNTFTSFTPVTPPPPGGGGELGWPAQLTLAERGACARELSRCDTQHHLTIVRELIHRLARHDLPPVQLPHRWVRELVRAAAAGTLSHLASSAQLTPEQRAAIDRDYQHRLQASRERGELQLAKLKKRVG